MRRTRQLPITQTAGTAAIAVLSALFLQLCSGCAARPADPRTELAHHNDEFWAYLAGTYDANGDGHVAADEYRRGSESFRNLDRDGDGVVTRADLEREVTPSAELILPILFLKVAGEPGAKSIDLSTATRKFCALDRSGDGRVSRAEFERVARDWFPGMDKWRVLLEGLDHDHDGLLSRPEVEWFLAGRDMDGDGQLSVRERATPGPAPREGLFAADQREPAPDFIATDLESGASVALSSRFGPRPIALIFGSFT